MRNLVLVLQVCALLLGLGLMAGMLLYADSGEYKTGRDRRAAVGLFLFGLVLFGLGSGLVA